MKLMEVGASWFGHQLSGLERYYMELVTHLPALGVEVIGVVYELHTAPRIKGLNLISLGTQNKSVTRQYMTQRRLLKAYLSEDVDLVASHCTPSLFPSLRHLGNKPLICHFHGPRYLERSLEGAHPFSVRLSKYIEKKVYARADHMITLSHYMKRVLVETYGCSEEEISVVSGGVNTNQFKQEISRDEARQRLEIPNDRKIILSVRRLAPRMGLHNLIDAMKEVIRLFPDVLLLIAGRGPLRDELDCHIQSTGLHSHVRMIGAVPDQLLPVLYRAADFSIVPTTAYEGFGLIILESLASGTPVLGTPQGAIPEVLTPLAESLVLKSSSAFDLAEGMLDALRGERAVPSMESCEKYAAKNFAWPLIAAKIESVYRRVVQA